jgi:dTDP-D-glucose 4,6-dehydratase
MRSVITSDKLYNTFKWRPSTTLQEGLQKTVNFFRTSLKNS